MMKKYAALLILLSLFPLSAQVYLDLNTEISSRYLDQQLLPAGKNPVMEFSGSAYFARSNIGISSRFVQSLGDLSAYRELGLSVHYSHAIQERLYLSGGLDGRLFPYPDRDPYASLRLSLTMSDMRYRIPYMIETHLDPLIGSWYTKVSAAYTLDAFLPFQFQVSAAFDALSYSRLDMDVTAGLSDLALQVGTYLSLKNWYIQPKLSYIIILNVPAEPRMLLSAKLNAGYTF
jgi:hypothetical protein